MKHILLTFFITVITSSIAQNSFRQTSIKGQAMGNASVLNIDLFSSLENISGLSLTDSFAIGLNFQNSYFLKELQTTSVGAIYSGEQNSVGIQYQKFGGSAYNESKCGIVYGKQLHESISFGARINYHSIRQNFYGNASLFDFELGLRAKISNKVDLATHLFNPLKFSLTNEHGEIIKPNSGLRVGIMVKEKRLNISTEIESSNQSSLLLKTGIDWEVNKIIQIQLGARFPQLTISSGLELQIKKTTFNVFYSYHTLLEHSSGLGLHYDF